MDGHRGEKWSLPIPGVTLPEEQERIAGQVTDIAVARIKQFLPSWAIFLSNVHLAALVQERRKQMVVFTQG